MSARRDPRATIASASSGWWKFIAIVAESIDFGKIIAEGF